MKEFQKCWGLFYLEANLHKIKRLLQFRQIKFTNILKILKKFGGQFLMTNNLNIHLMFSEMEYDESFILSQFFMYSHVL